MNDPMDLPVPLPISTEELDTFVANIVSVGNLPNTDDTYESIATLIMHMNQGVAEAPIKFFIDSVNKSRANAAAYAKLREFADKRRQAAQAAAPASNAVDTQPSQQVSTSEQPVQQPSVQKTSGTLE